jgi:hypothetical protein
MWERKSVTLGIVLEYQLVEVALDYHVLYGTHCDFEKVCIGSVCEMAVDLLLWVTVQSSEFIHKVLASSFPIHWVAREVREAVLSDWAPDNLLFEQVHLV